MKSHFVMNGFVTLLLCATYESKEYVAIFRKPSPFNIMKKIIIIFLSCMLLYPSLVLAKGQTPIEIPIHTGDSPGERPRSQSKIPITCYLYENNNTMSLISASAAFSVVVITNNTSGENAVMSIELCATPTIIPLLGFGDYNIVITLSYGEVYYGEFAI